MDTFSYNSQSLLKNGRPFLPVMGEFHFSRYHAEYWEEELEKMKAGGVSIVAAYVFWLHHEEIQGQIRWDGDLDVGRFFRLCKKVGLYAFLRIGPWCHGEARNGGFPDWLMESGYQLRTDDPRYLAEVERFWRALYEQVKDSLYQNGGPVIGIQIENEYGHVGGLSGEAGEKHMRTLTALSKKIGLDAPLMTATGWGGACIGDLLPVMGGYVEAPWAQTTGELHPSGMYVFTSRNHDDNDSLGDGLNYDPKDFPMLSAELGGGLQVTYNRRPRVSGDDTGAMSLVKLGSGMNLLGYYVYHGGTNPVGQLSSFQENRAVGDYCDLPELTYDFQAPLSEYGQVRDSYRTIRLLAWFLQDFGEELAQMDVTEISDCQDPEDTEHLRTSVRSKDGSGYLFVNNDQRRHARAAHPGCVLKAQDVTWPAMDIADGEYFFLPFHMKLGGHELVRASVTPLCRIGDTYVFYGDRKPDYVWAGEPASVLTLSRKDALHAMKVVRDGKECLLICEEPVIEHEGDLICLAHQKTTVKVFSGGTWSESVVDVPTSQVTVQVREDLHTNYQVRTFYLTLDGHVQGEDVILTIDYEGSQAELWIHGEKAADDFYRSEPWVVGLKRWGLPGQMVLKVYALEEGAPVFLDEYPEMENHRAMRLNGVTAEEEWRVRF